MELTNEQKQWLREAVDRGELVLTEAYPDWRNEMRLQMKHGKRFDMNHCDNCVLGLSLGRYLQGAYRLFPQATNETVDGIAAWHGFNTPWFAPGGASFFSISTPSFAVWSYLEELWIAKLREVN